MFIEYLGYAWHCESFDFLKKHKVIVYYNYIYF